MVRINRVHGFREYIHQLHRVCTLENSHGLKGNCLMQGGHCKCKFIVQCRYTKKDGEDNGETLAYSQDIQDEEIP